MAGPDPSAELAARLAEILRQRREANDYPLTAARLRELTDPQPSEDELSAALKHASFLVAAKKDLAAPVALAEDAEQLARCDQTLEYALGKLASADKPLHPVARIVSRLDKTLQPTFETALNERLTAGVFPASVGRRDVKDEARLYLTAFPPSEPKVSPSQELAQHLVKELTARQQQGQTINDLADLCPADTPGSVLKKALSEDAFTSKAFAIPVSKTQTLATLSADRDALLSGDRLMLALLDARTSAKKPLISPSSLTETLPEAQRTPFMQSLEMRMQSGQLPSDVLVRDEAGQPALCLAKNLSPSLLLAEKVVPALRQRRESGRDYPVRLRSLIDAEAPGTPTAHIDALLKDKSFRGQIVLACGQDDSPVVLVGDEQHLATSRLLLEYAVEQLSTPEQPLHPLKKIAGKIDPAVRSDFEQAVEKHLAEGTLPSTIASHNIRGQVYLRRSDLPLPPPADEALAGRLLAGLKEARQVGNYPLTLRKLLLQVADQASDKLAKAALAHNVFRAQAILALPGNLDSLVALSEDGPRLANDPRLLEYALTCSRKEDNQALTVADVCKELAQDLRPEFTVAVGQWLATGTLPETVGYLVIKKKVHLFLKADLSSKPVILTESRKEELPEMTEEREDFTGEMANLEQGRSKRPEEETAPVEQGDLFAETVREE